MYTSQLFYILSALAAMTVQAAPSRPPAESVVVDTPLPSAVSYAGAPANGEYPEEVAANGGWESDSPTYDTAVSSLSMISLKADLMIGCNCRLVSYYCKLFCLQLNKADH